MVGRIGNPRQLRRHFVSEWRKARGLTQQELADAIGASKAQVSRVENYNSGMTTSVATLIAQVLNIEVETLWNRSPAAEAVSDESDLVKLYRAANPDQQKAILRMTRALVDTGDDKH